MGCNIPAWQFSTTSTLRNHNRQACLDVVYEIVQPDETAISLSQAVRRAIGLVRLSGDDRNDRDLRLVQGSALDRLLSDKGLRSRLASELANSDVKKELADGAKKALTELDEIFIKESLPHGLDLAITGSQGYSIAALIGLTAQRDDVQLPLANWQERAGWLRSPSPNNARAMLL